MTALELARAQFAFTVSFHFLIPAFSIACFSRGRSPPGSTNTPSIVRVHHSSEQFCSKAVTGTIAARRGRLSVMAC